MFHTNSIDEIQEVIDGLKQTLNLIDHNDSEKKDIVDAIKYEISLLESRITKLYRIN